MATLENFELTLDQRDDIVVKMEEGGWDGRQLVIETPAGCRIVVTEHHFLTLFNAIDDWFDENGKVV